MPGLSLLALMGVNVGASVINNWLNNKQYSKLQGKQQEFKRAATERDIERMRRIMREEQELKLEIERENHLQQLDNIKKDYDNLIASFSFREAIYEWPLKVLPIVMKNQTLGNLLDATDENIAVHCILAPSNCQEFNKHIMPILENELTAFCNQYWNNLSSHPILFYSGAWKGSTAPTGAQIRNLKTNLKNLPTILISPFFKPEGGLLFQLNVWGIGVEIDTELECADFSYAASYKSCIDYIEEDDIKNTTIEELVPYLQCLIGYIADQYFWTNHNETPLLPTLLAMNVVNTNGMQYLKKISKERYYNLYSIYFLNEGANSEMSNHLIFHKPINCVDFLSSLALIDIDGFDIELVYKIMFLIYQSRTGRKVNSLHEIDEECFVFDDFICISKLINISKMCNNEQIVHELFEIINNKTNL